MAPIFRRRLNGEESESEAEVVVELTEEEKERLRLRQEFLRSGIPEELRRKETQGVSLKMMSEYAPWPDTCNLNVRQLQQVRVKT